MPEATVTRCDWLDGAGTLTPACVDLLYADPPFNTGAVKATPANAGKLGRSRAAYADAWDSPEDHAAWLRQRLLATLPALKPTASVLIHCDWRSCHHVRLMLDDVLGVDNFVNHLVWQYGLGGSSPRTFARKHDDILLYRVDFAQGWFEAPRVPATSNRMKGQTKKATDVLDIASLNNMSRERTGYPTQKPLALLDVLVRACCPPGGLVLDPCCGSGTTLVAAVGAGQRAVGFDTSTAAVHLARSRLALAT